MGCEVSKDAAAAEESLERAGPGRRRLLEPVETHGNVPEASVRDEAESVGEMDAPPPNLEHLAQICARLGKRDRQALELLLSAARQEAVRAAEVEHEKERLELQRALAEAKAAPAGTRGEGDADGEVAALQAEVRKLTEQLREGEEAEDQRLRDATQGGADAGAEVAPLRAKVKELEEQMEEMEGTCAVLEDLATRHDKERSRMQQECWRLREELKDARLAAEDREHEWEAEKEELAAPAPEQVAAVHAAVRTLEDVRQGLMKDQAALQASLAAAEQATGRVKKDLAEAEAKATGAQEQCEVLTQRVYALTDENAGLRSEREELAVAKAGLVEQCTAMGEENKELEKICDMLEREADRNQEQQERMREELATMEERAQRLTTARDGLVDELRRFKERYDELESDHIEAVDRFAEWQGCVDGIDRLLATSYSPRGHDAATSQAVSADGRSSVRSLRHSKSRAASWAPEGQSSPGTPLLPLRRRLAPAAGEATPDSPWLGPSQHLLLSALETTKSNLAEACADREAVQVKYDTLVTTFDAQQAAHTQACQQHKAQMATLRAAHDLLEGELAAQREALQRQALTAYSGHVDTQRGVDSHKMSPEVLHSPEAAPQRDTDTEASQSVLGSPEMGDGKLSETCPSQPSHADRTPPSRPRNRMVAVEPAPHPM